MEFTQTDDKIVITEGDCEVRFERSKDVPNPQFWNAYYGKRSIGYVASLAIFNSKLWTVVQTFPPDESKIKGHVSATSLEEGLAILFTAIQELLAE